MCGILGIYNINKEEPFLNKKFEDALFSMNYRGPDSSGIKIIENKLILGHLRLSIIDLNKESNQPFEIDRNFWLIFNGEIYNYLELKDELIGEGYTFKTAGDTEVLLKSYQYWGEKCVEKFNGMWAFAIYDKEKDKLFCSRDRFGIKPFNYSFVDDQFIFSSEIKGIISYFPHLKIPNYNVIANYCRKSLGAQIKETWFENIFRLSPAHNITIDRTGAKIYRYWDYPRKVNRKLSFEEAISKYRELLMNSVKLRMRSDVPVGFTLSSGIDSSSLVCLLKDQFNGNNKTYTAAFQKTAFRSMENKTFSKDLVIDEVSLVKRLTGELNLEPDIIEVNYDNYVDSLSNIIYHLESAHSSPAIFPLSQVFNEARKDVTVVLEGQGADELLGGYINTVFPVFILELLLKFKFKQAYNELKIFKESYSLKTTLMLIVRLSNLHFLKKLYFKLNKNNSLFKNQMRDFQEINDHPFKAKGFDNLLNKHLYKEHTGTLVNLLHYGDALSMKSSLESRLPFIDYRLVEFGFTLPSKFKVQNGLGKYIHRMAMEGIVPDYIIKNPIKFGFDSPLSHLFDREGENSPKSILLSEKCIGRGLFSEKAMVEAFREHTEKKANHSRILYRILSVELWFRQFIDK